MVSAGTTTTSAGGRMALATDIITSEIPVDRSPDSSADSKEFPAIKLLLKRNPVKSHQRNGDNFFLISIIK
jgi:hypothetical protein